MNRKMKKAFTLVEMLIVIIIIGILIGALFPKLKGAQSAARDTSRQTALSNISTALFQYQSEEWVYPKGACTSDLTDELEKYLSSMPSDPQAKRITYGTKDGGCKSGSFAYAPLYYAGTEDGGFVLVANTESEWKKSNFVLPHTDVFFTGSDNANVSSIGWNDQTNLSDVDALAADALKVGNNGDAKIYDSRVVGKLSCKNGVEITGVEDDQTMCKQETVDKWLTMGINNMTYVVSK